VERKQGAENRVMKGIGDTERRVKKRRGVTERR
jgi:hypothetical protein